ncbi:Uncharacterized protein PBTT_02931 [Plasmodiophora brassicae]
MTLPMMTDHPDPVPQRVQQENLPPAALGKAVVVVPSHGNEVKPRAALAEITNTSGVADASAPKAAVIPSDCDEPSEEPTERLSSYESSDDDEEAPAKSPIEIRQSALGKHVRWESGSLLDDGVRVRPAQLSPVRKRRRGGA